MIGRFACLCLLLMAMPLAAYGADSPHVDVRDVIDHLKRNGGKATVEKYFSCEGEAPGYKLIEQGTQAALEMALEIYGYTDGCAGESITTALSWAMVKNPAAVLSVAGGDFIPRICVPVIWEGDPRAPAQYEAILDQEAKVMRAIRDPSLQEQRATCLAEIARTRADIPNWPSEPPPER